MIEKSRADYSYLLAKLRQDGSFSKNIPKCREHVVLSEIVDYLYDELVERCTGNRVLRNGKIFNLTYSMKRLFIYTHHSATCYRVSSFNITADEYARLVEILNQIASIYHFTISNESDRFSTEIKFAIYLKKQ